MMTGDAALETVAGPAVPLEPVGAPDGDSYVVYTAIFGDYDDLPTVEAVDARIRYIAFTDAKIDNVRAPWEVRHVAPVFADPQRNARRVKLLPHLFLPRDTTVSIWVDASLHLRDVNVESIGRLLGEADITCVKHANRDCIYDEAEAVLQVKYDSSGRVRRQLLQYAREGFPRQFGLHATMFLVRRHFSDACKRLDMNWWSVLCRYSKRDQLSFDYARWVNGGVKVRTLPFNHFSNPLFTFKLTGGAEHKSQRRIVDEHLRTRLNDRLRVSSADEYVDLYDMYSPDALAHLRNINHIMRAGGEVPRENLLYYDDEPLFLFSPPDSRKGPEREVFLRAILGRERLFDMNFGVGHNALLALAEAEIPVSAIDGGRVPCGEACAAYLAGSYPNGFLYARLDENTLLTIIGDIYFDRYDAIHVDGKCAIEKVSYDLACAVAHGKAGAVLVVTSIDSAEVRACLGYLVARGLVTPAGDLQTEHAAAYLISRSGKAGLDGASLCEELMSLVSQVGHSDEWQ